jgi:hypothetical protein
MAACCLRGSPLRAVNCSCHRNRRRDCASFVAAPGVTYFVRVAGMGNGNLHSLFTFALRPLGLSPPANDAFVNAEVLEVGVPAAASNAMATAEPGEVDGLYSVWYKFTAEGSGPRIARVRFPGWARRRGLGEGCFETLREPRGAGIGRVGEATVRMGKHMSTCSSTLLCSRWAYALACVLLAAEFFLSNPSRPRRCDWTSASR